MMTPVVVKFGRFRMRLKARKRIHRATDGMACFEGTWLVVDGRVRKRDEEITAEQLANAYVRLGWGPLDGPETEHFSATPFACLVPYQATSQEIEDGWMLVADLVVGEEW